MSAELIKAFAAALAADEGREMFASDYPRAVRFINLLGDHHVTVDHDPPMAPMDWSRADAAIANIRKIDADLARFRGVTPSIAQEQA